MRPEDPLILGAGPAGCAAAIMLAGGGARPTLLEATRETGDALCGGFLSWRTLETLHRLGLDSTTLGGHPVSIVRLFAGARFAEASLPGRAIGISRRRLDSLLAARAVDQGAALERGVIATSLGADGALHLKDGARLLPDSLFVATGKHELRGLGRARTEAPTLGLRLRLPAHPALSQLVGAAIELHLFAGGYAGLVIQEDGSANLCMAVRKSLLASAGTPTDLIEALGRAHPALGERLSFADSPKRFDALAAIPYGWIGAETRPGLFRLGDQAACIPSLAGEGNGLALAGGMRAAQAWQSGGAAQAPSFQRAFAASVWRPVTAAKALWHAAESPRFGPALVGLSSAVPQLTRLAAALTRH